MLQNASPSLPFKTINLMKKAIAVLLVLSSFAANAQMMNVSKVPAAVTASFAKNFPAVSNAKWEKEHDEYEANFKQNGQKMSASFDAAGTLKETEKTIPVASLPSTATKYLHEHYKGESVKEASELKMADGSTYYEAEVKGMDVIFDGTGKFVKTQEQ
jgi:hypothetical protein